MEGKNKPVGKINSKKFLFFAPALIREASVKQLIRVGCRPPPVRSLFFQSHCLQNFQLLLRSSKKNHADIEQKFPLVLRDNGDTQHNVEKAWWT